MSRLVLVLLMLVAHTQTAQTEEEKESWDQLYAASAKNNEDFNPKPNGFLVELVRGLRPGKALDVGMGQGRNALYLARQGWDVTGFDISEVGVKQALDQAKKLNVKVNALVQRDSEFDFGTERWDLVVLSYVPFRHLVERVRQSLKPNGVVMMEYFHRDTKKIRPIGEAVTFASNELLQIFSEFRILRYEDVMAKQDWGIQVGEKNRLVRLSAQKEVAGTPTGCTWEGKPYPEGGEVCWDQDKLRCGKTGWDMIGNCN